jgi:hypothetical protein
LKSSIVAAYKNCSLHVGIDKHRAILSVPKPLKLAQNIIQKKIALAPSFKKLFHICILILFGGYSISRILVIWSNSNDFIWIQQVFSKIH